MAKHTAMGKDDKRVAFVQFLLELLECDEVLGEFHKYLEDPNSHVPTSARQVLGKLLVNAVKPAFADEFERLISLIEKQNQQIDALRAELSQANALLGHLSNDHLEIEAHLGLSPEAQQRFRTEFYDEKRSIARYLIDHYFSKPMQCFFQASTTAFHVVEELPAIKKHLHRVVIHSNSFALPYFVLGQMAYRACSVYPVCGQIKDYKCCGWLFDHQDAPAEMYLRTVLDKVDVAFVTPQYMDVSGNLYFAAEQTINLVQTIWEVCKHIVVLTPAPRIVENSQALPSANVVTWNEFVPYKTDKLIELVVAGKSTSPKADFLQTFETNCRTVMNSEIKLVA